MNATNALWLLCVGRTNGGAFAFALNFLWSLSFFQEKESDRIEGKKQIANNKPKSSIELRTYK
jgi:hypothetical protein